MTTKYDVNLPDQGIIRPVRQDLSSFHPTSSHFKTQPGSTLNYLNIPFAQPPTGSLRWRPPNGPAPSWENVRHSKMGNIPLQAQSLLPQKAREGLQNSEDCLYLNVYKPLNLEAKEEKLPILVWVYGGAFVTGSINNALYDFSRMAHETRCIIVSVAYRVNIFGFLGSRSLSSEDPGHNPLPESMWNNLEFKKAIQENKDVGIGSGNYGIWDVLAGLEWIQKNLSHFNGDLSNITIFGESAGAILIDYLLKIPKEFLPQNYHLFHKVVLQSGSVWTVLPRSIESAQSTFDKLMEKSDCKNLEELRSKDGDELREIVECFPASRPRTEFSYSESQELKLRCDLNPKDRKLDESSLLGPVWDGLLIPKDFRERISNGNALEGNLANGLGTKGCLIGYVVDEGSLFNLQVNDVEKLKTHANGYHPDVKQELKELYGVEKVNNPSLAFAICSAYTGDMLFQVPTQYLMLQLSKSKIPTYGYVHAHRRSSAYLSSISHSANMLSKMGVMHASEMGFLFGLDGRESHQFQEPSKHFEERKDLERNFQPERLPESAALGFQSNERDLSLEMMKIWGDFARGLKEPFERLNTSGNDSPSQLKVRSFGNCAQLGASSDHAQKALKDDSDPETDLKGSILRLEELNSWKEKVGDCKEMEEKYQFWMKDHGRTIWKCYYGDERLRWEP